MSIPIKIQHDNMGEEWKSIFILADGSLYGANVHENRLNIVPLSRSYTGQVIKDAMKLTMTEHHYYVRQAALARRSRDFVTADRYRGIADKMLIRYKNLEKMWDVFRSFSPKVIRKKERAERFKAASPNVINNVQLHYISLDTKPGSGYIEPPEPRGKKKR